MKHWEIKRQASSVQSYDTTKVNQGDLTFFIFKTYYSYFASFNSICICDTCTVSGTPGHLGVFFLYAWGVTGCQDLACSIQAKASKINGDVEMCTFGNMLILSFLVIHIKGKQGDCCSSCSDLIWTPSRMCVFRWHNEPTCDVPFCCPVLFYFIYY